MLSLYLTAQSSVNEIPSHYSKSNAKSSLTFKMGKKLLTGSNYHSYFISLLASPLIPPNLAKLPMFPFHPYPNHYILNVSMGTAMTYYRNMKKSQTMEEFGIQAELQL